MVVAVESSVVSERRLVDCITYLSDFIHAECIVTICLVPDGCSGIADGE